MLPARRRLSSQPQFTPRQLFAAMKGAWLEPPTGAQLGPELVTNGDFSNGLTGWSALNWTVNSGALTASSAGTNDTVVQSGVVSLGKTYLLTFTCTVSSGSFNFQSSSAGYTLSIVSVSGTYSQLIIPTASGTNLGIRPVSTFTGSIDNISVKEAVYTLHTTVAYQDNTGVTPVTAPTQTVGLLLDQSQGMLLGPELVTNGDFSNGTTGWGPDPGATLSVSTGQLTISVDGANSAGCSQSISTVIGATYQISVNVIYVSAGTQSISAGTSIRGSQLFVSYSATLGDRIGKFIATTTTTYICWSCGSSSRSAIIDNISVKQVLGNHAYQATAANRPTFQLDSNSLPLVRHDATDYLTVSLPNLGGGVFSASGSVYFATPQGMSALHNQSMGTTYNLPAPSTDVYAWCVTPARLNAAQEAQLERYFIRQAGIVTPNYMTDENGNILTDDLDIPLLAG